MGNKDFAALDHINELAAMMPDARPAPRRREPKENAPAPPPKPKRKKNQERIEQYSLAMRSGMRRDIAKLAVNADMTIRAFILDALKAKGLKVDEADLVDQRKR
jgi:hypothetical protein